MPIDRRPHCARCELPLRTCICNLIRPVEHRLPIAVLQHPDEVHHAKGTLRLLQGCLRHCETVVGERWESPPWPIDDCWLLYPGAASPLPAMPPRRLLLIDASWRHSRKLMLLNPWLHALPRYALREAPASLYGALRKAHAPQQLSSLEAVAQALLELEGNATAQQALLAAMQDWLALQRRFIPPASGQDTGPCASSA